MQKTPLLLSSPNSLPNECEKQWLIYLISAGVGLLPGLILFPLTFNPTCILIMLVGGLLGLGIGWGIADKIARAKCLYLRSLLFRLPAPLNASELYTQLAPQFVPGNIPIEIISGNQLRITYNGIFYTICYVNNSCFTINWSQSFGKALFTKGFYGSLYKKLITGMGFIGYYVQQACNPTKQILFSTTILPPTGKNSNVQSPLQQCPYCHTNISPQSHFCGSCGRQLTN